MKHPLPSSHLRGIDDLLFCPQEKAGREAAHLLSSYPHRAAYAHPLSTDMQDKNGLDVL